MKTPHPLLLDDLCRQYRRTHTRSELLSWWQNATRHFDLRPEFTGENEPEHVTAARALWVHANLDRDPQARTEFSSAMWMLVETFTATHARAVAAHRGEF